MEAMDPKRRARMAAYDSLMNLIDELDCEQIRPSQPEAQSPTADADDALSPEDASLFASLPDEG